MIEDLKNYDNALAYFVLFNIALFILIELKFEVISNNTQLISLLLTIPIYYFPLCIFNNLLPSDWKFFALYPIKHNYHYASDIFSRIESGKIKVKKELIDINLIFKKHRHPQDNDDEDNLWFELYYKHRYDNKVYQQHRRFLFYRDYTMMILPLYALFIFTDYVFKFSPHKEVLLLIIAIIEFLILWTLTIYQNRKFALAVLQEESFRLMQTPKKQHLSQKSKKIIEMY